MGSRARETAPAPEQVGLRDVARHALRDPSADLHPLLRRVPFWKLRLLVLCCATLPCVAGGLVFLLAGADPELTWQIAGIVYFLALVCTLPYVCSGSHDEGCRAFGAFALLTGR